MTLLEEPNTAIPAAEAPPAVPPAPAATSGDDTPRKVRNVGRTDLFEMAVALCSGVSLAVVLSVVMDWTNPLTLVLWACLGVSASQWLLVRDRAGSVVATDRLMTSLVWSSGAFAVGILGWMIVYVAAKGIPGLSLGFFTEDMSKVGPLNPGGGAFHSIVGTLAKDRHGRDTIRATQE